MLGARGSSLVHTRACNLYLPSGASGELNLACRWYRRHCLLEKGMSYFIPGFNEVTNVSLFFISMWLLYFSQLSIKGFLTETESPGLCVAVIYMQGRSLPSFLRDDWCLQPSLHKVLSFPWNGSGCGCFQLGPSPCLSDPWFSGALKPVPNLGCASSPTSLWLSSQVWLIPPNLHYGPTEDLQADVVHDPVPSQSNNNCSCCSSTAGSVEGILWPVMNLTAPTSKVGSKSWHCDALVIETCGHGPGRIWQHKKEWHSLPAGALLGHSLYRLISELRDFFLGWIPESQCLRHCLHDWMPSVFLFPIYLCEQHVPLLFSVWEWER